MKYFAYLLVALLMASCLPENLETDVEEAESKLVISSQVIPNTFMVVTVTRSFSALEGSYGQDLDEEDLDKFLVRRALVVLSYTDRSDTLFTSEETPGVFFSRFKLEEENQEFELYVYDSTSQQSVTSRSTMLPRVSLSSIAIKKRTTAIDFVYDLNYTLTDPEGDNWYVLNVFDPNEVGSGLGESFSFEGNSTVYTELISDQLFSTENIEVNSELLGYRFGDTVAVMLSNISQEYFRFLDARQRGGSLFSSITGEPINHPTNINGGYGFFNTHNPSITQAIIEEE